jgi:tRNA A-37 threonylcarbamoyl transferase component Bud32
MKLPAEFTSPVRIGAGAFASVYRVRQKKLQRNVALKIIPSRDNDDRRSIVNEAHLLAAANLSCAPHIYDIRLSRTSVIIVMEWISGIPLSLLLEQELSSGEQSALAADLINGLAHLHKNNIVHRDLKPGNVIAVPDRGIVFVDFGFSCTTSLSNEIDSGKLRGTPAYMAPELWKGGVAVDLKKADLYALGIMLQQMFVNDLPTIAMRCMQSDPNGRPADAVALAVEWKASQNIEDRNRLTGHIAGASAEYTSRLLYGGAAELCSRKRREEAYPLLTESIRLWPDNPEALLLLQSAFSAPITGRKHRQRLLRFVVMALLSAMIIGAYLIGRESTNRVSYRQSIFGTTMNGEGPLLMLPRNVAPAKPFPASLTLRTPGSANELIATLTIICPVGKGALLVDGNRAATVGDSAARDDSTLKNGTVRCIELPAGSHRIEWHDSASNRRFGETVDCIPFSRKTISLARFITHDQQPR